VVTITPEDGWHAEPSVAINPHNSKHVVVGFQSPTTAYSLDGGETWSQPVNVAATNYKTSGDVSVTFDTHGRVILCHIAFDKLGTKFYWAHNPSRNGVFIHRSEDGGKTWEPNLIPVVENATGPGIPFEDKPYLLADHSNSRFAGNVYVGWTEYSLTQSVILFSRSTDGGQTWSKPLRISTRAGVPHGDDGAAIGFTGTVGPDGTIYAVWSAGHHIAFTYSKDGGRTFASSRFVIDTPAPLMYWVYGGFGGGVPQIGIDPRSGHERLYVTSSDWRNGDADVFCATSLDGGRTWTPQVRVNNDPVHNGKDQYLQWLAVDPVTGAANVIFYDRRDDPEKVKIVLAQSTDGGRTFTNYSWTSEAFDLHNESPGDYIGIAARDGHVYGAWTEVTKPFDQPPTPGDDTWFLNHVHEVMHVGVADFSQRR
jgi:Neuraminidase (sialidase)